MRMTLIALPFAIYLHTTTAFVLALNKSRELWNTAVMVPIFLTSATASGVALLLICAYIMQHYKVLQFTQRMFRSLATLLATVIIIDLFLLVVEMLVIYWRTSAKPGHTLRFNQFLFGEYAPFFLPVLVLGGIAFALLAGRKSRHVAKIQITASAMYVFAIFLKRYSLMAMGFVIDPLGQLQPRYYPSLVEVLLALGVLAVGLLIMTLGAKVLPLRVPEDEHGHDPYYWEQWVKAPEPSAPAPAPGMTAAEAAGASADQAAVPAPTGDLTPEAG
jgi:molybdopterin-containing oxidoreductase family membrane subunit